MRPSLTVLLASLAGGCTYCGKQSPSEEEETYAVTDADLQAAMDAHGGLNEEACHDLCRSHHWFPEAVSTIHSCSLDVDASYTAETPSPDTSDTGAPTPHAVTCAFTEQTVCEGRAHAVLASHPEGSGPTALAAWLARAAHAEAASVHAFVALSQELTRHRAPAELVQRCLQAAREEVSHARRMGDLAASHGGRPTQPRLGDLPDRPLVELAIENIVEGCVRETWSAMVAHWQAGHAADPHVRQAMARIATDEASHGDLAASMHDWMMTRLSPEEARRVLAARDRAVADLLAGLDEAPDEELVRQAGLPTRQDALRLARALASHLWSDAVAA